MTQQHLVMVPAQVSVPRGAIWAADVAVWAAQAIERAGRSRTADAPAPGTFQRRTPTLFQVLRHKAWQALERHGQRRAAHELLATAQRWQSIDPDIARSLREAAGYDTTTPEHSSEEKPR